MSANAPLLVPCALCVCSRRMGHSRWAVVLVAPRAGITMCLQARLELLTKLAGTARSISLLSWISAGIGLTEFFIGPTFGKLSDAYESHSLETHPCPAVRVLVQRPHWQNAMA